MIPRLWSVALCGYYGFGNLGDELLAKALILGMERCGVPRGRLVVLSGNPERTSRELGVAAVNRWKLREVWEALSRAETLLLGGGGLFQDSTSLRSALYYAGVVHLARRAGCRPWAFGQSVGPLKSGMAQRLARNALRHCVLRVVRDEPSETLLKRWKLECRRTSDAVFLLAEAPEESASGAEKVLLVNVRPWPGELPRLCARNAATEAARRGWRLMGVALAPEDEKTMEYLRREGDFPCERVVRLEHLRSARDLFRTASAAVGMRLHFLVLATLFRRPAAAVPYDPKVWAFAQDWGLPCWDGKKNFPDPQGAKKNPDEAREEVHAALRDVWSEIVPMVRSREGGRSA